MSQPKIRRDLTGVEAAQLIGKRVTDALLLRPEFNEYTTFINLKFIGGVKIKGELRGEIKAKLTGELGDDTSEGISAERLSDLKRRFGGLMSKQAVVDVSLLEELLTEIKRHRFFESEMTFEHVPVSPEKLREELHIPTTQVEQGDVVAEVVREIEHETGTAEVVEYFPAGGVAESYGADGGGTPASELAQGEAEDKEDLSDILDESVTEEPFILSKNDLDRPKKRRGGIPPVRR